MIEDFSPTERRWQREVTKALGYDMTEDEMDSFFWNLQQTITAAGPEDKDSGTVQCPGTGKPGERENAIPGDKIPGDKTVPEVRTPEVRTHVEGDWLNVPFEGAVDLNDPATYEGYRYRDWDCDKLRDEIYRRIGLVTLYEKYFDCNMVCPEQSARIQNLLFWFSKEHRRFFQDSTEGRFWLRKWLFIFENETENLC